MRSFQRARREDLPRVMALIEDARRYLQKQGVDQWQNGYPAAGDMGKDLEEGSLYLLMEGETLLATVTVSFRPDPNYAKIYDGEWPDEKPYGVIHRLAVSGKARGSGCGKEIIGFVKGLCREKEVTALRVDTHRENRPMRGLLEGSGFIPCGRVYMADGGERVAYHQAL